AVRGSQADGLDQEAFSTGLDRHDLQTLLHETMKAFDNSAALKRWRREQRPTVAVLPMRNETSEHVDSALEALVSDIETILIEKGEVRVISLERQPQVMDEIRRQHSGAFNPSQMANWGRQVGAKYFVTGKVFSSDERLRNERRVQYYMFMQIIEVETSDIIFQHKSQLTKAILQD
ncbi:MAG: penicillin-binding protein activator LpoB, partial [Polyangiaceae bacterium]|nr:penicillin-binding protein activator LpoB [Polyangiaceae bacterium]